MYAHVYLCTRVLVCCFSVRFRRSECCLFIVNNEIFFSLFTAGTDDAHVIDIAPSHQNSTFSSLIIEFCICANTSVMQDNICSPFSLNNIRYGVHFVSIFDMKFQFRFDPLKKFFYWNENEHFQLKSNVQPILDASITGYATYISNYAYIQNLVVHMNWVGLVYVFRIIGLC